MAITLAVGDVLEFRTVARTLEQNFINVFHYEVTAGGGAGTDIAQVGQDIEATLQPEMIDAWPSATLYQGFGIKRVFPTVTAEVLVDLGEQVGSVAADAEAFQACALVSLRSDEAPPGTRGRKFFGPLPVGAFDPATQQLEDAYRDGLVTWLAAIATSIVTTSVTPATLTPIIWSRLGSNAYTITGGVVRHGLATQRRRASITRPDQSVFS